MDDLRSFPDSTRQEKNTQIQRWMKNANGHPTLDRRTKADLVRLNFFSRRVILLPKKPSFRPITKVAQGNCPFYFFVVSNSASRAHISNNNLPENAEELALQPCVLVTINFRERCECLIVGGNSLGSNLINELQSLLSILAVSIHLRQVGILSI